MCSKTRSGRDFSPYALDGVSIGEPIRVDFDLGAALRAAEARFETEPMSSEDAEDSDDECELVRPPPTRPLSTHEKAALAPALFADYLKTCSRGATVPSGASASGSLAGTQWDGLSKDDFQKKRRRAQRSARLHTLVEDPSGLRGRFKPRALEHLAEALREADESRVRAKERTGESSATEAVMNSQLAPTMEKLQVASSAYVAKRIPVETNDRARIELSDLKPLNIEVVPWNGR